MLLVVVPNTESLLEVEAMPLDLHFVVNSAPVLNVGSRRYDIIYTSHRYSVPQIYAMEYDGNEVALARLRKVLSLHPNTVEASVLFITKYKKPVDEGNVKEYATQMSSNYCTSYSDGQQEIEQDAYRFHLLEGKIPENYESLDNFGTEDCISPHSLISQLPKLVQPWS